VAVRRLSQPAPEGGGRAQVGSQLIGLGLLCVAIPVMRDLVVRDRPGSGTALAAIAYTGLLCACFVAMRAGGIAWGEVGIRAVSIRSVVIGVIAGILVIAPVWRLPAVSFSSAEWLVLAVAVEEVAFRGVLFAILRRMGGVPLAIGGSAAVFTAAHIGSVGWPSLVLVALAGLYLGLLRALRGDLWTSGIAHLVMDVVSLP
jgi:membrane protease YdiL (CAAX protease family)